MGNLRRHAPDIGMNPLPRTSCASTRAVSLAILQAKYLNDHKAEFSGLTSSVPTGRLVRHLYLGQRVVKSFIQAGVALAPTEYPLGVVGCASLRNRDGHFSK